MIENLAIEEILRRNNRHFNINIEKYKKTNNINERYNKL